MFVVLHSATRVVAQWYIVQATFLPANAINQKIDNLTTHLIEQAESDQTL